MLLGVEAPACHRVSNPRITMKSTTTRYHRRHRVGSVPSLRQTYLARHIRKSRVGAQAIEDRINLQVNQPDGAVADGLAQPGEGFLLVAESRLDDGNPYGLHVSLRGARVQFFENFLRLGAVARLRIRMAQGRQFAAAAFR